MWCKFTHCCRYNKNKNINQIYKQGPNTASAVQHELAFCLLACFSKVAVHWVLRATIQKIKKNIRTFFKIVFFFFFFFLRWFAHLIAVIQENMVNKKLLFNQSRCGFFSVCMCNTASDRYYSIFSLYSILNSPFSTGALPPSGGVRRTLEGWKRHILKRVCLRPVYINCSMTKQVETCQKNVVCKWAIKVTPPKNLIFSMFKATICNCFTFYRQLKSFWLQSVL